MKAEWVNAFLRAAEDIFRDYGLGFKIGKPTVQHIPILGNEVNVAIGITGEIKGQVILSLSTDDALGIAKKIVPWELDDFDEIASSSVSELTNILAGRASANLEQTGISTDLSVPSIITGSKIKVFSSGLQNIIIPFSLHELHTGENYSGFLSVGMQPQG